MTLATDTARARYGTNGTTGPFTVPFYFLADDHLAVYHTDSAGIETQLTISTHYSVSGAGSASGGTVTTVTAYASGGYITIIRAVPVTQLTDYQAGDAFAAESHETALDKATMLLQQFNEVLDRALVFGVSDTGSGQLPPAATRANRLLGFDSLGVPVATVATAGDASALTLDLANTSDTAKGDQMIGLKRTATSASATTLHLWMERQALDVRDFGAVGDGSTNDAAAIQAAVNAAIASNLELWFSGTSANEYKINSAITITGQVAIRGMGLSGPGLLCNGCDGFVVSAGTFYVDIRDLRIAQGVRYTTTPNAFTGININGTTASQCYWNRYANLFIDGFETSIVANGVAETSFVRVFGYNCKHGITSVEKSQAVTVRECWMVGGGFASSYGIRIGDGVAATESWIVDGGSHFYNFARGAYVHGSANNKFIGCYFDYFQEFGVLLSGGASSAATTNDVIGCYFGAGKVGGGAVTVDSAIYCSNAINPATGQDRGHNIIGNQIWYYTGATLTNGILVDGAQERYHRIAKNTVQAGTYDCRITVGQDSHMIEGNHWRGPGFSATVRCHYLNNNGTLISLPGASIRTPEYHNVVVDTTYGASITHNWRTGNHARINVTNGTAFTLNEPSNLPEGELVTFTLKNTSGGSLGAITWNGVFKFSAWTSPANGFSRSITFRRDGSVLTEMHRTTADIPN